MTYLTNMYMPVDSIALAMAFQLAVRRYFCLAVSGNLGSIAGGGGGLSWPARDEL